MNASAVDTAIDPALAAAADATRRVPSKSLTQDDFIRLIITQVTQQDPFKAADSGAMLEQFTTLGNYQSMQNMTASIEGMTQYSARNLGQSLVGRTVEVRDTDGGTLTGTVSSTLLDGNTVRFFVDGREFTADDIVGFLPAPATTA